MSLPGSGEGFIFTPAAAGRSEDAPLLMSIDTRRVSLPGSGAARRLASVCSAVVQYAMIRRLSVDHFGLPQKLPCSVTRFTLEPSGCTTYTSAIWRCSQRPCAKGSVLPRSDEKAIHCPSGDHDGRKLPAAPEASGFALRVSRSSVHRSAVPPPRVVTNTSCRPSGENAAWSSYAGLSVRRSRPLPSGLTRYRSADPSRSDVRTIHA